MRYVSRADTISVLSMQEAMRIIEDGFRWQADGQIVWSQPGNLWIRPDSGLQIRVKGCFIPPLGAGGLRLLAYGPDTTRLILVIDAAGRGIGLVDEHWTYSVRTACSAAVAAKYLAPPGADRLGLIGAGQLAWAVLGAYHALFPLRTVRATSRTAARREALATRAQRELGLTVEPVETPEDAVRDMPLVVTCTSARRTLVQQAWLAPGSVTCALGQFELEEATFRAVDHLVVDSWDLCLETPDVKALLERGAVRPEDVRAEIHEVVTGKRSVRTCPADRIVVRAVGLAYQDIALAHHAVAEASRRRIGMLLPTDGPELE